MSPPSANRGVITPIMLVALSFGSGSSEYVLLLMPHEHSLVLVPLVVMAFALLLLNPGDFNFTQLALLMCGSLPVLRRLASLLFWYRSSKISGNEVESPSADKNTLKCDSCQRDSLPYPTAHNAQAMAAMNSSTLTDEPFRRCFRNADNSIPNFLSPDDEGCQSRKSLRRSVLRAEYDASSRATHERKFDWQSRGFVASKGCTRHRAVPHLNSPSQQSHLHCRAPEWKLI